MLVFPQLSTGASALYPISRQYNARSVVNLIESGSRVAYSDANGNRRAWEFRASGLTSTEKGTLENLFVAAEGQLKTFTLLDPVENLVAESEDFQSAPWIADALLQVVSGQPDPFGSNRATQFGNLTGTSRMLTQVLAAPGNFQYTFSVWARSTGSSAIIQTATSGSAAATESRALGNSWQRFSFLVSLNEDADEITLGFEIPPGAVGYIFGAQVEPQPGASEYKRTHASRGIVPDVRFASDELTFRAQGEDVFDTVIRLVSVGS